MANFIRDFWCYVFIGGKIASEMSRHGIWQWLTQKNPAFANVEFPEEGTEDVRLNLGQGNGNGFSVDGSARLKKDSTSEDRLQLLLVDWTFGTEELSAYSSFVQQVEKKPCLFMHSKDATRSNLKDKDKIILAVDGGPVEVELCVAENMAPGVIVLPRHRQVAWQRLKGSETVSISQIKKA